jgi:hypothetical protein
MLRTPAAYRAALTAVASHAHHGFHLNLNETAAWLAAAAAFATAWIALRQLRAQAKDLARQAAALERQQADHVDMLPVDEWNLQPKGLPTLPEGPYGTCATVCIANNSNRPVRNVVAKLRLPGQKYQSATMVCQLVAAPATFRPALDHRVPVNNTDSAAVRLIRAGESWHFAFPVLWERDLNAESVVHFTDDAGLSWQINSDLHLERVASGRRWFGEVRSGPGPADFRS